MKVVTQPLGVPPQVICAEWMNGNRVQNLLGTLLANLWRATQVASKANELLRWLRFLSVRCPLAITLRCHLHFKQYFLRAFCTWEIPVHPGSEQHKRMGGGCVPPFRLCLESHGPCSRAPRQHWSQPWRSPEGRHLPAHGRGDRLRWRNLKERGKEWHLNRR